MCSSTVGKNESCFEMPELSFEHLLTYLSLSINWLLKIWLKLWTFYLGLPKNFLRWQPWHHCETNSHQSDHDNGNDQVPSTLENHPLWATTLKCQNVYFKVLKLEPLTSNHDLLLTATFFLVDDVVFFYLLKDQELMHAKLLYQHMSNNTTMLKPW